MERLPIPAAISPPSRMLPQRIAQSHLRGQRVSSRRRARPRRRGSRPSRPRVSRSTAATKAAGVVHRRISRSGMVVIEPSRSRSSVHVERVGVEKRTGTSNSKPAGDGDASARRGVEGHDASGGVDATSRRAARRPTAQCARCLRPASRWRAVPGLRSRGGNASPAGKAVVAPSPVPID